MSEAAPNPYSAHVDVAGQVAELAGPAGRSDLADRLRIAVARITRPATIVCVVGEFKQGKSSLINALVARRILPVDDDLATSAITLVRHGPAFAVEVKRRVDGRVITEPVPDAEIADWVSESGNPGNRKDVDRVEVALPSPLLETGLCLVDTPGMGSLGAGHAAATLAFLPFADGMVFVSDASAELSAPEAEFLGRARELCPNVVVVLSKVDIYPRWREILDLDIGHLKGSGCDVAVLPLSADVRWAAIHRRDARLDARSGYPSLFAHLQRQIIQPAKAVAADRAAQEAAGAVEQLRTVAEGELAVVDDPARLASTLAQAAEARERLDHLSGPGARWGIVVSDRVTDLSNDVLFRFRGDLRRIVRDLEDAVEEISKPTQWDDLARRLQTEVGNAVTDAFVRIDRGGEDIKGEVIALIAEEGLEFPLLPARGSAAAIDVMTLWAAKPLDPTKGRAGAAFNSGLTGLRGAQSGIIMFGMMGRFLPIGVGALVASNPVTLSMGAVFGSMQLLDAHKRKIAQRRLQARTNVRQFADDVQFEVGNLITDGLRAIQRALRDEFTLRITELQRTHVQTGQRAQEAATADAATRQTRGGELRLILDQLSSLRAAALSLQGDAA